MNNILLGIVVPGSVFLFSFVVTYMLYRHFSKSLPDNESKDEKE